MKTLDQFLAETLRGRHINWFKIPPKAVYNFGNVISLVLYRQPPFQLELFIIPDADKMEDGRFAEHKHLYVDSYNVLLSGDMGLFINGAPAFSDAEIAEWGDRKPPPKFIGRNDMHYANIYSPVSFLAVEEWLDDVEPTSVGMIWDGDKPHEVHQRLLTNIGGLATKDVGHV